MTPKAIEQRNKELLQRGLQLLKAKQQITSEFIDAKTAFSNFVDLFVMRMLYQHCIDSANTLNKYSSCFNSKELIRYFSEIELHELSKVIGLTLLEDQRNG